jgi:hypothetical protein
MRAAEKRFVLGECSGFAPDRALAKEALPGLMDAKTIL